MGQCMVGSWGEVLPCDTCIITKIQNLSLKNVKAVKEKTTGNSNPYRQGNIESSHIFILQRTVKVVWVAPG